VEQLRGRNALLTGAAGGIGGYIARALAAEGTNLVLSDLPEAPLDDLVAELRGSGVEVEVVPANLADRDEVDALIAGAEEALGPIDILVNNAGLEFAGPYLDRSRDEVTALIEVNLIAPMLLTRAALPGMLERGRGHVVNIASIAGKIPSRSLASYSASKHGVIGFTHTLRADYGDTPVGFSSICPGFVARVGMYGRIARQSNPPPPLRPVQPEQVATAVVRAIREDRAQTIVNGRGIWPLVVLAATAPGLLAKLSRNRRAEEFSEEFSKAKEAAPETAAEQRVHAPD
jgi:short-subunit dehydrogenase